MSLFSASELRVPSGPCCRGRLEAGAQEGAGKLAEFTLQGSVQVAALLHLLNQGSGIPDMIPVAVAFLRATLSVQGKSLINTGWFRAVGLNSLWEPQMGRLDAE